MEIDINTTFYINLVIEELVVNVVNMAKDNKKSLNYVDIRVISVAQGEAKSVMLRVRDNLTQFDPSSSDVGNIAAYTDGMLSETAEDDLLSGSINELGLGIVKEIAKEYQYRRTIGYNNFLVII